MIKTSKDYIIDALFILMKDYDFDEISVTQIAQKAGVSRATFYRFFLSKEEVIISFLERETNQYLAKRASLDVGPHSPDDIISSVFGALYGIKEEILTLVHQRLETTMLQFLNKSFSAALAERYENVPALIPYIYAGLIYNVSLEWIKGGCKESVEEVSKMVISTLRLNVSQSLHSKSND